MILKYGNCIFYPSSTQSRERVEQAIINSDQLLIHRLETCDLQILVLSEEPPILDWVNKYPFPFLAIYNIWRQWKKINSGRNFESSNLIHDSIVGDAVQVFPDSKSRFVYGITNDKKKNQYLFLLPRIPQSSFPSVELALIGNISKLQSGNLLLHSAAIIHHDRIFLFGGPSGAGKSTVSNISRDLGDYVLDEDQVRIEKGKDGIYTVGAWGYSIDSSFTPLFAIIKLVKDSQNQLFQLSKMKTAEYMFDRTKEVFGYTKSPNLISWIFQNTSMIARQIPGYELHFRKSPDFWKLIDTEFGLD